MEEYTLTGSLFESTEKIKVYTSSWNNSDINKVLIQEWKSTDIIDLLKEEDKLKELAPLLIWDVGFKIHHVKCEINPYNNSKIWKLVYSVYRSGSMGGGVHKIEDMDIKIRDIKLRKIL